MSRTAQSTAVATLPPMEQFRHELNVRTTTFGHALPPHVPVEKFKANLVSATAMTPKLLDCNRASLFKAAMTAAQLGLMVDPVLGHAYLVPYGNVVQCIPGYKGFIHLARQSGEIAALYAHEVYENDEFDVELGTSKRIHHKPRYTGERGKLVGVYAAWSYTKAVNQDGALATDFEFMTIADIEAIRKRSKAGESGPWKTDYIQMARKTVIRRAAKYLPLSVQRAAVLDAAYEDGRTAHVDEGGAVVIDAEDITDATPQGQAAGTQLDGLEQRMAPGPSTAPQTAARKIPDPRALPVPDVGGGPDYKGWADAAVAALQTAKAAGADAAWFDKFEALNKAAVNDADFNAADEAARVRDAVKRVRA